MGGRNAANSSVTRNRESANRYNAAGRPPLRPGCAVFPVAVITPPFPDASYTVSATPSTNTTVWVPAGRTLAGFALSQATYGGTCDLVISR